MCSCHLQEDSSLSQENVSYTGWPISLGVQSLSFCLAPFEIGYDVGGKATIMENFIPPAPRVLINKRHPKAARASQTRLLCSSVLWPEVTPPGRTTRTAGGQSASRSTGTGAKEKAKHLLKHLTEILQLKQARALATSYIPCAMFALTCYLLRLLFF